MFLSHILVNSQFGFKGNVVLYALSKLASSNEQKPKSERRTYT